jgi:chromosome segregation ATPase
MSFMKKALGSIIEFDAPAQQPQTAAPVPITGPSAAPVLGAGLYDATMLETLQKVVISRKTPYTALVESAAKLATVIPDETQRLKAAFVTIAIDVHCSDLSGQLARFNQSSDVQVQQKAGALRSQAKTLTDEVARNVAEATQINARLAALAARNAEASSQAAVLNQQADTAEAEVKAVTSRFEATVTYAINDLKQKQRQLSTVLS